MATNEVTIAAVGFTIRPVQSFDEFADHVRSLLDEAKGSDLVVFPELFTLELFTIEPDWQQATPSDLVRVAEHTASYREVFADEAKLRNQFICAGSHLERRGDEVVNVSHLFGPDGERFEHLKTHLFPEEGGWNLAEGDEMRAFDLPFARVGINICYEMEIPECASSLAEQGAEIILCPSYTFTEHGLWRVRHTAQARAIENQVYVVHSATGGPGAGPIPPGWTRSSVLSPCDLPWTPNGVVVEAETNVEHVVVGTVDLDVLRRNRLDGAATTFRDRRRRRDLYRRWPSHLSVDG